MMKISKIKFYLILGTVFLLSIAAGFLIGHYNSGSNTLGIQALRQKNTGYKFIEPLLGYDFPNANDSQDFKPLVEDLNKIINDAKATHKATDVSVYLRSGQWIGINEDAKYSPASLAKVPIMIAYLKVAQAKPEILNQSIQINAGSLTDLQTIQPENKLQPGQSYSVRELINRMIRYSDNDAAAILRTSIDPKDLEEAYTDLGINYPGDDVGDVISPKSYALYFRLLYNATYLSRDESEEALKLLSETDFNRGLRAGVPNDVVVAHKFGERENSTGEVQFHDCGIVYAAKRRYILCVMSRGTNLDNLIDTVQQISQKTYEFIDSKN